MHTILQSQANLLWKKQQGKAFHSCLLLCTCASNTLLDEVKDHVTACYCLDVRYHH